MASITKNPVSVVNDPSYGSIPWAVPDGFRVKFYASSTVNLPPGTVTQYAKAIFDFQDLPIGVTLTGIKLEVQANDRLGDGYPGDASVRIGQSGTLQGDDKARPNDVWSLARIYRIYGGDGDLWGAGIPADSIRTSGIEVYFAARHRTEGTARIIADDLKLALYYA